MTAHKKRNNIRLVNLYAIAITAILACLALILEQSFMALGTLRVILLCIALIISELLNRKGYANISSFITIFSCYAAFLIYPILPLNTNHEEDLLLLIFTFTIISVFPYIVYNIKRDKIWILAWLIILTGTFPVTTLGALQKLDDDRYMLIMSIVENEPMLIISFLGCWIFLQVAFYRYHGANLNQKENISKANSKLRKKMALAKLQNNKLDNQKQKLISLQNDIQAINDGLEEKVKERTFLLENQRVQLEKYGFINTRLVRLPVKSVTDMSEEEISATMKSIQEIVDDLDAITLATSELLNEKNYDPITAIETSIKLKYTLK